MTNPIDTILNHERIKQEAVERFPGIPLVDALVALKGYYAGKPQTVNEQSSGAGEAGKQP